MTNIKLLGAPHIENNEAAEMRGRKAWALLAYLIIEESPPTRSRLAELLFSEADDPVRALRWNLAEIRRALRGASITSEGPVVLTLPEDSTVDVVKVISGHWSSASQIDALGRPLLEGLSISNSPAFETWLLNKRRYLFTCAASLLREATLAQLGDGRYDRAVDTAAVLVGMDPLNEEDQALLIRCYAAAGDTESAARQLGACTQLLRDELGVEPGPAVLSAIAPSPTAAFRSPPTGGSAVRARLEAGRSAIAAGATEAGIECLRNAAGEAHSLGDLDLNIDTWLALGAALAHNGRASHTEAATALHRASQDAQRAGRTNALAEAHIELAWIEFLAARYNRSLRWVSQALEHCGDDPRIRTLAYWIRGKCWMETGSYARSLADLERSVELSDVLDDPARRSFCLASLGRTLLMMRSLQPAREALEKAIEAGSVQGFTWTTPLPEAFLGEVEILEGNLDEANDLLVHSLAAATQLNDSSFESFACRALGLLAAAKKKTDDAFEWLERARSRMIEAPDCEWTFAYSLDALANFCTEIGHENASRWTDELEDIAARTGMKEMACRALLYRYAAGSENALAEASVLASGVDNPALHKLLDEARVVTAS